jgi:RNA polymerase sigma factor (sigma-70 family)
MTADDDVALLRRYAEESSQSAFAELVRRHINLVYSAALRRVGGDAHLANDVAQQVFTALARSAQSLTSRATLAGWLYTTTRFAAAQVVRGERRRHARETEVHTMQHLASENLIDADWERLRPLLDRAMDTLGDADREAVLLRFFEGRSFAQIGTALRLSEDAARMRVDRALDKLHGTLARSGMKSTAAALGAVLANQASAAAPTGLAANVATAALAGAATAGTLSVAGALKVAVTVSTLAALAAVGAVVHQRGEARAGKARLVAVTQEREALNAQVTAMQAQLRQVEQRIAEAEKDNGELLKAVEGFRTQSARAAAARASVAATDDERTAYERAYQLDLARRRVVETKAQLEVRKAAGLLDAMGRYERFLAAAEEARRHADFRLATRWYNDAMMHKPAGVVLNAQVTELQAALQGQNQPVDVMLISDRATYVSISGQRGPERFETLTAKLLPGNYEVIGRRRGFHDVIVPLQVRNGTPPPTVSVACTMPVKG